MTRLDIVRAGALALALSVPMAPSAEDKAATPATPANAAPAVKGEHYAVFETSRGKIGVRLLAQKAPRTVATFVALASGKKAWTDPLSGKQMTGQALFDGTLFHRVIPAFMIQGGDPLTRGAALGQDSANGRPFGTGDPGFRYADELEKPGATPFNTPCQLANANSGPDTNGSQFFITEVAYPSLNPRACPQSPTGVCGYVHFGEGVCGCELVKGIAAAGKSQTRLVKVTITSTPPTCK